MCEQTMPYTVGSWVWCKLLNRVWWPGKVVKGSDTPKEFQVHTIKQRNYIAIVYFEKDNSYECVTNMDKIFLYSCAKKMEFVKTGYSLFIKQKKGERIIGNYVMANFIEDVMNIEKIIGGNINIFSDLQTETDKSTTVSKMIKELFVTSKDKKKNTRKSLQPIVVPPVPNLNVSLPINKPSTSQTQPNGTYGCYYQKGCPFSTNRYDALKRHVNMHKAEAAAKINNAVVNPKPVTRSPPKPSIKPSTKPSTKPSEPIPSTSKASQKPNKRKTEKNIKEANKKVKLEDEILKDWDDDDEENAYEDEVQNIDGTVANTTSNIQSTSTYKVDFDEKDKDVRNKDLSITSSNESSRFDSIVDKLDNETDTDDVDILNESNELPDRINDQNSTISYTENTSDQLMSFEDSNLSCDVNESDASAILIKNNKVIDDTGVMIMDSESSNTNVKNGTDGLRNDDNMLVKNDVEPIDNLIVSNKKTSVDKGGIKQKIKEIPGTKIDSAKKDDRYECWYDKLTKPNWMEVENWESKMPAVIEEAKRTLTFDKMPSYLALPTTKRMPQIHDIKLEPQPDYEVIPPTQWRTRRVWMEVKDPPSKVFMKDELNAMPVVQDLMKKVSLGKPHNAFITIEGANFFPEDDKSKNEKE